MVANSDQSIGSEAEQIFAAALEVPAADRPSYLATACGNNQKLRNRVEALVRAHEAAEGFLPDQPGIAPAQALELAGSLPHP